MLAPKRSFMQQVAYLIGMYGHFLKVYVKTLVEYRADTIIAVIAGIVAQGSMLIFLTVIFKRIPMLAGWDYNELVFMFGLAATGRALNQTFFNAPFMLTGNIRNGRMDMMMVRPVGVLFQTIGYSQELNGVGQLITGMAIMGYAASHLEMSWTFLSVLYVVIALLCSALIQFSILLTISVLTFWFQEIRSLIYPITWLYDFTRYPMQIFHPILRGLLTYVIPYSLASFYPAAYLLRPEQYGWAAWGVPAVTMVVVMGSYFYMVTGVKALFECCGINGSLRLQSIYMGYTPSCMGGATLMVTGGITAVRGSCKLEAVCLRRLLFSKTSMTR